MNKNIVCCGKARFSVLTENLIRVEYDDSERFEDDPTQIVVNRQFEQEVKFEQLSKNGELEIVTSALHLYYTGGEFSANTLFADVRFNFSEYDNRWYFGEKNLENLGGTARTLDKVDGSCELEEGIVSRNGFAILKDDSFVMKDEEITGRKNNQIDFYLFAYGRNYRKALQDFYRLTGFTPLLPRYALGNWWSRYHKYSEQTYLDLIDKFESKGVPLSVAVIDMDWHLVDDVPTRFGSGWTGYTWNKKLFPDSRRFLSELHTRGLKTALNVHPADGIRAFETFYPAVANALDLNTELEEPAVFDFDNPEFRQVYFDEVHHRLEEEGIDFWWLDWQQGTTSKSGIDPLWQLNHYHYKDIQRKGGNDIILSRYAGPGSHRTPIGFSGDTVISWASLDFQPYFTSTATNIGYTWWSHDIGGHMHGQKDEELSLRWLQLGVFSPINRLHSSNSAFTSKEPWHFGLETEQIMEEFLRFRHSLIPYLFSANIRTAKEGRALIEPMYYEYPLAEQAYKYKNQYLFGSELMISPITKKSDCILKMSGVSIWFPEGTWFDFFTGQIYEGGVELKIFREKKQYPVFARAGSIIPLSKNPLAKEKVPSELVWYVFPGKPGEYELLEESNQTVVKVDENDILVLVEKKVTNRLHTIIYAGREIVKGQAGNFEIDLNLFPKDFGWSEKNEIFRRLDLAEIEYDEKDFILKRLNEVSSFNQRVAFVQNLDNQELRTALFECIYSGNSHL
ncbi:glycoside hydrolase family 31 protein [Lactococcus lactis]|uniref:glycoside hydrolase family 31 protein n=1 Tax=Lactococcus lactis TaxID=1358 RepID=UPI00288EC578|nr:TIM-barrel domain-containing protein [Lactococcus lactis]MDT2851711.1 glycoside hydrolase family 31 protein [Lactococcus lactis]